MVIIYKGIALFVLIQLAVSSDAVSSDTVSSGAVSSNAGKKCANGRVPIDCVINMCWDNQGCEKYKNAVCFTDGCGEQCEAKYILDGVVYTAADCKVEEDGCYSNGRFGRHKCQFPFKYGNKVYNDCTRVGNGNEHWCYNKIGWGVCESDICTIAKCKFPFTYKTKSYDECTRDGDTKLWCEDTNGDFVYC